MHTLSNLQPREVTKEIKEYILLLNLKGVHAEDVWSNFNLTIQEATDVLHAIEAWLNPNIFSMLKTFDQAF
jgi:hypothetical protein